MSDQQQNNRASQTRPIIETAPVPSFPSAGVAHGAVQHRCHPRAVDIAHVFTSMEWFSIPERVGLWYRCYKSEPGFEPTEPFLVDPKTQGLRFKDERVIRENRDRVVLERQLQKAEGAARQPPTEHR